MRQFKLCLTVLLVLFFTNCVTFITHTWTPPKKIGRTFEKVRVLLDTRDHGEIVFKAKGHITVHDVNDVIIKKAYDKLAVDSKNLRAKIRFFSENNIFQFNGKSYRGDLFLVPENDKVYIINEVGIEEYLFSVVPSEMPNSWPMEALKAQAICARTYAMKEMINKKDALYDVDATTNSQVYSGMEKENSRTTDAVEETQGILATYQGAPIQSFFHSNSGGMTERPENLWGGKALPYLTSVKSEYCKPSKEYSWIKIFHPDDISAKFNSFGLGKIQDIQVLGRTDSGRVDLLEIAGTTKTIRIKGSEFRNLMGTTNVKSLLFGVRKEADGFMVKGLGYGHGVGLSQWGSMSMAQQNYNYKDILTYYFKGIDLARITQ